MTAPPIVLADMPGSRPVLPDRPLRLFVYSGQSQDDALDALSRGHQSRNGPARLVIVAGDEIERQQKAAAAAAWLSGRGLRPRGVAFRSHPIGGETGFVFGGGGVDYRGMGADLVRAFPHLVAPICERGQEWISHVNWIYDSDDTTPVNMVDRLLGQTFLSYLHSRFTTVVLGLHPQAILGFSVGELSGVSALDAWVEPFELIRDTVRSTLYRQDLTGEFRAARAGWARIGIPAQRWENHLVGAPAQAVSALLDPSEPVYLTARCSPEASLIGGDPEACARLLALLNPPYTARLNYDVASHAEVVADAETALLALYDRPMHPLYGVRAYSATTEEAYTPGPGTSPKQIAAQAQGVVDFVSMVERAYADGVRVFVEHGPGRVCTGWIGQILAGRDHLAVAIDGDLTHLASVIAELVAGGVWCDSDAFFSHLRPVRFDRSQLEELSRRGRMPSSPMLLVDRITNLDTQAASLGKRHLVSETDLKASSWYLESSWRMPAGLMLEMGQANLLLISGLGINLLTAAERVYRFLGCQLTYHGALPEAGQMLRSHVALDSPTEAEGIRLFSFHFDCYRVDHAGNETLALSVRNAQAGFFTNAELNASRGVLWNPARAIPPAATSHCDRGAQVRSFTAAQVEALCPSWLPHEVPEFDSRGGPWRRGYMRAQAAIEADLNACMPSSLLLQGCLQAMSFYLCAQGGTSHREGWQFEPVPEVPANLCYRGQATPGSRLISYEVFVISFTEDPVPSLAADVLCTVDGRKILHASNLHLRLAPARRPTDQRFP